MKNMTYATVAKFFDNKGDIQAPYTTELINKGYRQNRGGYIELAKKLNIENPVGQWWHITSYCKGKIEQGDGNKGYRYTPCGELLFYMAEMTGAVSSDELNKFIESIPTNEHGIEDRKYWNTKIKEMCWKKLKEIDWEKVAA